MSESTPESELRTRLGKIGRPTRLQREKNQPDRLVQTKPNEADTSARRGRAVTVKGRLHGQLLDDLDRRGLLSADSDQLQGEVDAFVAEIAASEQLPLNEAERSRLSADLLEETLGLGPLASLMADPSVTDILVNGPHHVFVERYGNLELTSVEFRDADHLTRIIQRIASRVGRRIDESVPMVDARLPDGSRVNATLPPVTLDGPTLSIRRFGKRRLRRDELHRLGMFNDSMAEFFSVVVRSRLNILVSGGTGSGKSTFLGAICESIPDSERIVTIEDAAELQLQQDHVVRLETRPPSPNGTGAIYQRDLVKNALRMRPDRIIVGEVRGAETFDMLQAMNTGHDGSMTTVHANTARDALSRVEQMVSMLGLDLPLSAIRSQLASGINVVVQLNRLADGNRKVMSVGEITGMEGETITMQDIFVFRKTGKGENGEVQGEFTATSMRPKCAEQLLAAGVDLGQTNFLARGA